MTTRIYNLRPSTEEDRPWVEGNHPENRKNDWLRIDDSARGVRPLDDYVPPRVVVEHPDALKWDYYSSGGLHPYWSARAVELLGPYAKHSFQFLEAYINGTQYYVPMTINRLDCFDREQSEVKVFDHDPSRIMRVIHYAFHLDKITDPLIFAIPDLRGPMLCTDTIPTIIDRAGLRGFNPILLFDAASSD